MGKDKDFLTGNDTDGKVPEDASEGPPIDEGKSPIEEGGLSEGKRPDFEEDE